MIRKKPAFTLIEILMVIGIIVVLAGTMFLVINPSKRILRAQNVKKLASVETLGKGVLAHYASSEDGNIPSDSDGNNIPDGTVGSGWPGPDYKYATSGSNFVVYVQKTDSPNYFKFSSVWGKVKECGGSYLTDATVCPPPVPDSTNQDFYASNSDLYFSNPSITGSNPSAGFSGGSSGAPCPHTCTPGDGWSCYMRATWCHPCGTSWCLN